MNDRPVLAARFVGNVKMLSSDGVMQKLYRRQVALKVRRSHEKVTLWRWIVLKFFSKLQVSNLQWRFFSYSAHIGWIYSRLTILKLSRLLIVEAWYLFFVENCSNLFKKMKGGSFFADEFLMEILTPRETSNSKDL